MRFSPYYIETPRITPAAKWLLIVNAVVFVIQRMPTVGPWITSWGLLQPRLVFTQGQVWRLATYMFLHHDLLHLAFNMFALWMFSRELEQLWGSRRFVVFCFVGGIGSGLFSFLMWNRSIIGASGAIFALLTAYGRQFPDRQILLFFFFPVAAKMAAIVLFVALLLLSVPYNIAHLTHLGGIVVAYLFERLAPPIEAYLAQKAALRQEQERRRRAERYLARERFFAEKVDPILKKISEQGVQSLTRKEKMLLKRAAKIDPGRLKRSRYLPFDLFA